MTQLFHSTAVVGAGAVGSYFGAMLARAGHHVTLIGRAAHVQAIQQSGLQLHMADRVRLCERRRRPTSLQCVVRTWCCSA